MTQAEDTTAQAAEATSAIESIRSKVASIGNPVDVSTELTALGKIVEQLGYTVAPEPDDAGSGGHGSQGKAASSSGSSSKS
ncbi:MAG TPA: hypothetical protein VGH66_01405 [Acidimicrobiales bacterium]|jgi:hypothetical protein